MMRPAYSTYDYDRFEKRLSDVRDIARKAAIRAEEDEAALAMFVQNHEVSTHSHKGYIQWQGSEAQSAALKDLAEETFDLAAGSGGFRAMYNSDPVYFEEFPFEVFCDKIRQEIKTAKYIKQLKREGKYHKAS